MCWSRPGYGKEFERGLQLGSRAVHLPPCRRWQPVCHSFDLTRITLCSHRIGSSNGSRSRQRKRRATIGDYPKCCPNPERKTKTKLLPKFCPLGVVVRFRAAVSENITLRPYGQQLLMYFCSWDRKSLEHTLSSYFGY